MNERVGNTQETAAEEEHIRIGPRVPLTQHVTYRLTRLNARLNAQAAKLLKENGGISLNQWRFLVYLDIYDTGTLAGFVRFAGLDKGQSSRVIRDMVKKGLVSSKPDENDHRVQDLSLTAKGRDVFETALPHMSARQQTLYNSMTDSEREMFYRVLQNLEDTI